MRELNVRTLDLGSIPFYWRMRESLDDGSEVPAFLPFSFGIDSGTGVVIQNRYPELMRWLSHVYTLDSNIGYMQPGHALADRYGQDFLAFFDRMVTKYSLPVRRVLDVGCGGCYVLAGLRDRGLSVHGIDPSPVTVRHAARQGIPVRTGLYPMDHGFGKMDVVLSTGVLEHVTDPIAFLRGHHADLSDAGYIIVSLPDSGPFFELGDPSMVLSEHLSYFDETSLRRILRICGFEPVHVEPAGYGASLHALARPSALPTPLIDAAFVEREWNIFAHRMKKAIALFVRFVDEVLSQRGRTLGFYVPLRLLPYVGHLKRVNGFRLFDDDPGIRGKYFDGIAVPVESFEDLERDPVTDLIVMSIPHGPAILRKVAATIGGRVRAVTLESILREQVLAQK